MKKNFRYIGMVVLFIFVLQIVMALVPAFAEEECVNQSRMLKTKGNQVVLAEDESVQIALTGLNVFDYLERSHKLERSAMEAFDNWHSNIIRVPVTLKEWVVPGVKEEIDRTIKMASNRGKYVILDLHHYKAFSEDQVNFWKEAAVLYKNNPTVIFGILNEPHDVTWEQWRNGGGDKVKEGKTSFVPIGHQTVVEMIRDLGAKNIILAGGLDWGYDLRGIVGEAEGDPKIYALIDQGSNNDLSKAGNGIMYDTHIYPWKGKSADFDKMIGTARKQYPLLSGENGWDNATNKVIMNQEFQPGSDMYYDVWNPDFFKFVNDKETYGSYLNWTGWCFHPGSAPRILEDRSEWDNYDYAYRPTEYWGEDVKKELDKVLGANLLTGKTIINSSDNKHAKLAIDGDYDTEWKYDGSGEKFVEIALGDEYIINRWAVRNAGSKSSQKDDQLKNAQDFKIQSSLDGVSWNDVDGVSGNISPVTERTVKDFNAKYIRFEFTKASQDDDVLRIHDLFVSGRKPELNVSDIKVDTVVPLVHTYEKNATIIVPVENQSVDAKKVTVITAVFKNGKLDPRYKVKIMKKEIDSSSNIEITGMIPNDNDHCIMMLVYDTIDKVKTYQMDTVKE